MNSHTNPPFPFFFFLCSFNNNSRNYDFIKTEPNQCNPNNEYGPNSNPLTHLSDSVNSLDPLNAMEKSLNEQVTF